MLKTDNVKMKMTDNKRRMNLKKQYLNKVWLALCLLGAGLWLWAMPSCAQSLRRVKAEYIYHAPENVTLEQARQTALQRAKIQALADEFGTVVRQDNATRVQNRGEQSKVDLISLGQSEVKGEWIETVGEPKYDISYDGGMLVVKCTVEGKAREIVGDKPVFDAHVLRNGTDVKYESDVFRSGDDLFVRFRSPVDGFLNIYLDDGQGNVAQMLPYRTEGFGATPIKGNQEYVFFSAKDGGREVDEYTMTCNGQMELNRIVLVFSENVFTKVSTSEGLTDQKSFLSWLGKLKAHDRKACSQTIAIQVKQ